MSEETTTIEQVKTYPLATTDGYAFENEDDESLKIETKSYDNGSCTKRATLSNGQVAVCRKLKGKDVKAIQRLTGNDKDKYQNALISYSTTINDKPIVMEDLDELWLTDYNVIMVMSTYLNF